MNRFPYQIGVLGNYRPYLSKLSTTIEKRFSDLGLADSDFQIVEPGQIRTRERKAPFAAIYFGTRGFQSSDDLLCQDIIEDSLVILPVVDDLNDFSLQVPKSIAGINGLLRDPADTNLNREVAILLEGFRLLRADRRLFIRELIHVPLLSNFTRNLINADSTFFLISTACPQEKTFSQLYGID
jgi:hypothetical protein